MSKMRPSRDQCIQTFILYQRLVQWEQRAFKNISTPATKLWSCSDSEDELGKSQAFWAFWSCSAARHELKKYKSFWGFQSHRKLHSAKQKEPKVKITSTKIWLLWEVQKMENDARWPATRQCRMGWLSVAANVTTNSCCPAIFLHIELTWVYKV